MTREATYVAFDVESGGIPEGCSLLTAYFVTLDKDLEPIDELDLAVKPNNNAPYVVTAEGLSVNKINLIEHDKVAITASQAGGKLHEFLTKACNRGAWKLIPIGHNLQGDIDWVNEGLLSKPNFDKFVSYRHIDTSGIAQFLKLQGKIPDNKYGNLGKLCEFFGVEFVGTPHTAKGDTLTTLALLRKMRDV